MRSVDYSDAAMEYGKVRNHVLENGFMDSFSDPVAHLPKGRRTAMNVLVALSRFPFVSTWDMSEKAWLRNFIDQLKKDGLIEEVPESYQWHEFSLTESGKAAMEGRYERRG